MRTWNTNITPRAGECFDAIDFAWDRLLGEIDWHATRRAACRNSGAYDAFESTRALEATREFTDAEVRSALVEFRART